jgi:hypothetical protein
MQPFQFVNAQLLTIKAGKAKLFHGRYTVSQLCFFFSIGSFSIVDGKAMHKMQLQ